MPSLLGSIWAILGLFRVERFYQFMRRLYQPTLALKVSIFSWLAFSHFNAYDFPLVSYTMYPSCISSVIHLQRTSSKYGQQMFPLCTAHFSFGILFKLSSSSLRNLTTFVVISNALVAAELLHTWALSITFSLKLALYFLQSLFLVRLACWIYYIKIVCVC